MTGLDGKLFEHHRHDGRLARGADRQSMLVALDRDRLASVDGSDGDVGKEQVSLDTAKRLLYGLAPHGTFGSQTVHHTGEAFLRLQHHLGPPDFRGVRED
jgi:hypothetical protein